MLLCFVLLLYYYTAAAILAEGEEKARCLQTGQSLICCQLLQNSHRLHDYATEVLRESGCAFEYTGPWFANMGMVITCDPANIHYVLSKNFTNYPKGPEFRKIFDILGDGIFNADSQLWQTDRKVTLSVLHHPSFHKLLETTIREKVEKGLLQILQNCGDGISA